jgi:hypothetical protein
MKSSDLRRPLCSAAAAVIATLAISAGIQVSAAGESLLPADFSGLLNDYTPTVAGGPYEMHGRWSLHLSEERTAATFAADMTMDTADFANTDPNHDPTKLNAHTHHIRVSDGVIHNDLADPINWKTQCPTFKIPVSGGFVVTGTAYVAGNGTNPPFANPSAVTICILGGTPNASATSTQVLVEFSNFTLTFASGSPASAHFGTQAINGVVSRCAHPGSRESADCRVAIED